MRLTGDVTAILAELGGGNAAVIHRLLPLVYDDIHRVAARLLARERADHTLQPTALVHEVFLRLVGQHAARWRDRAHFVAVTAQLIRRILVDHARARASQKRGGDRDRLLLDGLTLAAPQPTVDLLGLHEALCRLSVTDPRKARVVELRFFGGLTVEEVAEVLGINARSVERDWQYARAWLFRELARSDASSGEQETVRAE
jgi:RNA polymerase sigma factor (TIGR02999 family)